MLLTKCCFCFNLRYGYFTYGILSMAARLMLCITFYHMSQIIFWTTEYDSKSTAEILRYQLYIDTYIGWIITSIVCLFFTLKGIVQKRSILIYPYIVVLVVEIIGHALSGVGFVCIREFYYAAISAVAFVIALLDLENLKSLFKHTVKDEEKRNTEGRIPFKTII